MVGGTGGLAGGVEVRGAAFSSASKCIGIICSRGFDLDDSGSHDADLNN